MKLSYLLIKCDSGSEGAVMERLEKIGATECTEIIGAFDIVARIEAEEYFDEVVSSILKMDKVRQVMPLDCIGLSGGR